MVRRILYALRARRETARRDAIALRQYRELTARYVEWLDDEAIVVTLNNLRRLAGDDGFFAAVSGLGVRALRGRVSEIREARQSAALDAERAAALAHLRNLVREVEGVDPSWSDTRRRGTLSGGTVTIGEYRAAKKFIDRIDAEHIAKHESAHKEKTK
jgi:hypothetical protein